jgi:hypothetical protein
MNPLIDVIILTTAFKVSKPQVLNSATSFPFLKEEATEHRARTVEVRSKQKIPLRVALPSQAERRHTSLSQRKGIVPEHVSFTNACSRCVSGHLEEDINKIKPSLARIISNKHIEEMFSENAVCMKDHERQTGRLKPRTLETQVTESRTSRPELCNRRASTLEFMLGSTRNVDHRWVQNT